MADSIDVAGPPSSQTCRNCGQTKPISEFQPRKANKLTIDCYDCRQKKGNTKKVGLRDS